MAPDDPKALALARWLAGEDDAQDRALLEDLDPVEAQQQIAVAVALHGLRRDPALAERVRGQCAAPPHAGPEVAARIRTALRPWWHRPTPWLATAAAALLTVGGWWMVASAPPSAQVQGPATWADGRTVPTGATGVLRQGEAIEAGPGAEVRLADGTRVAFESSARLAWADDGTWTSSAGRLRWDIAHQPPGQHFRCQAGATQIEVIGTAFVTEAGSTWSKVLVEEGKVHASVPVEPGYFLGPGATALVENGHLHPLVTAEALPITRRLADWLTAPGAPPGTVVRGQGPGGSQAVVLNYDNHQPPWTNWMSRFWSTPQDWRQIRAISLALLGSGPGKSYRLELTVPSLGTPRGPTPRFAWSFTDTAGGWRRVVVPLAAFSPRLDLPAYPAVAGDQPDWSRVMGLGLIATEGQGVVALADVTLLR